MATSGRQGDSLSVILGRLNKELGKKRKIAHTGLLTGGYVVLRDAQKLVPVDTGNLKGSGYVRDHGEGKGVEVGFTAAYAVFVHENLEAYHSVGQAKFLEASLNKNRARLIKLASGGK